MSQAVLDHSPSGHVAQSHVYESVGISKTRLGMWWFLASEIVTFGGVVAAYLMLRMVHPQWIHQSSKTLLPIGAINTVVLLTSSLTMVLAHAAAEEKNVGRTRKWLAVTLAFGVLFLCFKGYEYHHEIADGNVPSAAPFWGFYYCMTGLHALHVIAGLIVMVHLLIVVGRGDRFARVGGAGLYWHFVDIVWIFLFPLLYVTTHG